MENRIQKTPRIELVDALRGFAVMAILLVHNVEHFIFPVYPTDSPEWLNIRSTTEAASSLRRLKKAMHLEYPPEPVIP